MQDFTFAPAGSHLFCFPYRSLRLALQTTVRSNHIHETYIHPTSKKKAEVHYLLLLQFIPYYEPALSKTAALLLIKVVFHIFYILLKLC